MEGYENTEFGCLISKLRIKTPEQLERLIHAYTSGLLLGKWKNWFEKNQPQITQAKITVEIIQDRHVYLRKFFSASEFILIII